MFVDKEQTAPVSRDALKEQKERQMKCLSASDRRVAGLVGKTQVREDDGSTLMRRPSQEEREKRLWSQPSCGVSEPRGVARGALSGKGQGFPAQRQPLKSAA